jgi:hypothetical protein
MMLWRCMWLVYFGDSYLILICNTACLHWRHLKLKSWRMPSVLVRKSSQNEDFWTSFWIHPPSWQAIPTLMLASTSIICTPELRHIAIIFVYAASTYSVFIELLSGTCCFILRMRLVFRDSIRLRSPILFKALRILYTGMFMAPSTFMEGV